MHNLLFWVAETLWRPWENTSLHRPAPPLQSEQHNKPRLTHRMSSALCMQPQSDALWNIGRVVVRNCNEIYLIGIHIEQPDWCPDFTETMFYGDGIIIHKNRRSVLCHKWGWRYITLPVKSNETKGTKLAFMRSVFIFLGNGTIVRYISPLLSVDNILIFPNSIFFWS
jgi:hypothetical protein